MDRASLVRATSKETAWPATGLCGVAVIAMLVGGSITIDVVRLVCPTDAVTSAAVVVVSAVRASPAASVVTARSRRRPAVAAKATPTFGSAFPPPSSTVAVNIVVPPPGGSAPGCAVRCNDAAAAEPINTCTTSLTALPEYATTLAVPDAFPAERVALA